MGRGDWVTMTWASPISLSVAVMLLAPGRIGGSARTAASTRADISAKTSAVAGSWGEAVAPVSAMSSQVRAMDAPAMPATCSGVTVPPRSWQQRRKDSSHRGWESMSVPSMSHRTALM